MKTATSAVLSPDLRAEGDRLAAMPDKLIDLSYMLEVTDWSDAVRGRLYRPVKQQLTLRLDADVVPWFKTRAQGGGCQTRIYQALRDYVASHDRKGG